MIKNILFDLDGTLTDPFEGITKCYQFALEKSGVSVPSQDELRICIGPPLRDSFPRYLATQDKTRVENAVKFYRERFSTVGLFENDVYPEIPEMLEEIFSSGRKIFLATSKPRVYAEKILVHFKLEKFFSGIYGSELDGRFDNKVELISHIVEKEKILPDESVMIGDRMHDIFGGKKNFLRTIGVTWGFGSYDELFEAGSDIICDTPREITDAIHNWEEKFLSD